MIALFVLSSPIMRVQSPIYLQNYPELFLAPCCVSQRAPWLKRPNTTHINTRTHAHSYHSQHLVLWTGLFANSRSRGALWFHACCWIIRNPQTHLLSQISLKHGVLPGFKLYYWQSTRNNRAFASMVGLASDSPCWSTTWPGLDVIPGREQCSFILPL